MYKIFIEILSKSNWLLLSNIQYNPPAPLEDLLFSGLLRVCLAHPCEKEKNVNPLDLTGVTNLNHFLLISF